MNDPRSPPQPDVQMTDNTEELLDQLRTHARFGLLAFTLICLLLPWISVSFLGETITGSGLDMPYLLGFIALFTLVGIALADLKADPKFQRTVWVVGGGVLSSIGIIAFIYIRSEIGSYRTETMGNPLAAAVSVEVSPGLYGFILGSLAIFYLGYQMSGEIHFPDQLKQERVQVEVDDSE